MRFFLASSLSDVKTGDSLEFVNISKLENGWVDCTIPAGKIPSGGLRLTAIKQKLKLIKIKINIY